MSPPAPNSRTSPSDLDRAVPGGRSRARPAVVVVVEALVAGRITTAFTPNAVTPSSRRTLRKPGPSPIRRRAEGVATPARLYHARRMKTNSPTAAASATVTTVAVTKSIDLRTEIPGPRSRAILARKGRAVASPLAVMPGRGKARLDAH